MASYALQINGKPYTVEADPQMPLLWVIRDIVGLTGTKYGCGISQCGACTVLIDGNPAKSCSRPVSSLANQKITTIEGLSADNSNPGMDTGTGSSVRLLPKRPDHDRRCTVEKKS